METKVKFLIKHPLLLFFVTNNILKIYDMVIDKIYIKRIDNENYYLILKISEMKDIKYFFQE